MSTPVLREAVGVIEGEHHGFVVRGDADESLGPPWDGNTLVTVFEDQGAVGGDLMVHAADQWGPFEVTCRLLDGPPADPAPEWEDVVEVSISATTALVATEMIDNTPAIPLVDEPGDYRLRVHARGRVADREFDEDDLAVDDEVWAPIEWFLLEVWAAHSADPQVLRLTSSFAERTLNPPPQLVIPEGESGLAAAARIGREVDANPGERRLSGDLGSVAVQRTIRGTRMRLFPVCAHLVTWSHRWVDGPSWSFAGGRGGGGYDLGFPMWGFAHDHADQLSGARGAVRYVFTEVEKPHRAVRLRDWMVDRSCARVPLDTDKMVPLLSTPTTITVTLSQLRDDAGAPWTTIRIEHEALPIEWVHDMETYWDYQLAIAEHSNMGSAS
jgi:hypothetical protein